MKKIFAISILLFLALFTSGCVYLRLFEVKKQLAQFDKYFTLDKTNGLKIRFHKPVLYEQDMQWMGFQPTIQKEDPNGKTWHLVFEKMHPENRVEEGNYDIIFLLKYKNRKLKEVCISERYFAVIPKEFFIMIIKSMGGAKIDRKKKSASAKSTFSGDTELIIPKQDDILKLLGYPYVHEKNEKLNTIEYRYQIKGKTSGKMSEQSTKERYVVKFIFSEKEEKLKVEGKIPLLGSIEFVFEKEKPKKKHDNK